MMDVKIIKELGRNVSVLYLEDEEAIRKQMGDIFKALFKSVTCTSNGQMGITLFKKDKYDLVITDIQMPLKNGLEVAKEIKAMSPHTPVIVVTAYSNANLFISSIETGVDRYILKPISIPNLYGSLQSVLEAMHNKRKAEELHRKVLLEEINEAATDVIQKLADAFPTPTVAFCGKKLKFANEAFVDMFGEDSMLALRDGKEFGDFFEQKAGYIGSPEKADKEDYQKNKAVLSIDGKKQIVMIARRNIKIIKEKISIFTISNITKMEYQKRKNETYAELLEEILFSRFKSVAPRSEAAPLNNESNYLYLSQEEKDVLRKSRSVKYTAQEYTKELPDKLIEEMEELGELDSEWKELLLDFEDDGAWIKIEKISAIVDKYAKAVHSLIEFEDLSFALSSLHKVLKDVQQTEFNRRIVVLFLDTIRQDLKEWREKIFIKNNAADIHYLDSSLFSSCIQLQLKLGGNQIEDTGEDLELF